MPKYQYNFSNHSPLMFDKKSREKRSERIVKVLEDYFGKKTIKNLNVLDVGASTGIIDNFLAKKFKKVVGIDIDQEAIIFARKKFHNKNLEFKLGDAMKLDFQKNSFDIIICTQVYEHVPSPARMFSEINRVLRPGGVCYLAALNRFWIMEPHYKLPFLSWLPKNMGNFYVRIFGKAKNYYETPLSYRQLSKLTKSFKKVEYTGEILSNPGKYSYENIPIPKLFSPLLKYFTPTFFWLLVKI